MKKFGQAPLFFCLSLLIACLMAGCAAKDPAALKAEQDALIQETIAQIGPVPEDYRDLVLDYAESYLYNTYSELDLYIAPDNPEPKKTNDTEYSWHGYLCAEYTDSYTDADGYEQTFRNYDMYDYYLIDRSVSVKKTVNELLSMSRDLIFIATLGLSGEVGGAATPTSVQCKNMRASALAKDRQEWKEYEAQMQRWEQEQAMLQQAGSPKKK